MMAVSVTSSSSWISAGHRSLTSSRIRNKGFTIASDFILSLLPVTFIRTLRRSLYEKILIGCLMGAGMGATGIAIARLFLIMGYLGKGPTAMVNVEQDILWGLELTIGVLTASIPPLKAPMQRLLVSWGVLHSNHGTDMSSKGPGPVGSAEAPNDSHPTRQMRQWSSMMRELAPESQEGLRDSEAATLGAAAPTGFRRHFS